MSFRSKRLAIVRSLAMGLCLLLASLSVPSAAAADLDQAKQRGMVCELPTGYVQTTGSATADVSAMVNNINAQRKQQYGRIAKEHGVTPAQVGKLTARKLSPKCN